MLCLEEGHRRRLTASLRGIAQQSANYSLQIYHLSLSCASPPLEIGWLPRRKQRLERSQGHSAPRKRDPVARITKLSSARRIFPLFLHITCSKDPFGRYAFLSCRFPPTPTNSNLLLGTALCTLPLAGRKICQGPWSD